MQVDVFISDADAEGESDDDIPLGSIPAALLPPALASSPSSRWAPFVASSAGPADPSSLATANANSLSHTGGDAANPTAPDGWPTANVSEAPAKVSSSSLG